MTGFHTVLTDKYDKLKFLERIAGSSFREAESRSLNIMDISYEKMTKANKTSKMKIHSQKIRQPITNKNI